MGIEMTSDILIVGHTLSWWLAQRECHPNDTFIAQALDLIEKLSAENAEQLEGHRKAIVYWVHAHNSMQADRDQWRERAEKAEAENIELQIRVNDLKILESQHREERDKWRESAEQFADNHAALITRIKKALKGGSET
jgi:hypothetical protein